MQVGRRVQRLARGVARGERERRGEDERCSCGDERSAENWSSHRIPLLLAARAAADALSRRWLDQAHHRNDRCFFHPSFLLFRRKECTGSARFLELRAAPAPLTVKVRRPPNLVLNTSSPHGRRAQRHPVQRPPSEAARPPEPKHTGPAPPPVGAVHAVRRIRPASAPPELDDHESPPGRSASSRLWIGTTRSVE